MLSNMVFISAAGGNEANNGPCDPGIYGDKCQFQCSGNCANNATCDADTGKCPGDCVAGWEGGLCDLGMS
jgi:hypothetical protein